MDIFCVQEAHGSWADIHKHCRLITRDYWTFASFGEGYGGIITFISKKSCPNVQSIAEAVIVQGRAHRLRISNGVYSQVVYNVHNFELQSAGVLALCNSLDNDYDCSKYCPLNNNILLLGDLNLTPPGSTLFEFGTAKSDMEPRTATAARNTGSSKILASLAQLLELQVPSPSRYNKLSDTGVVLDRVLTNLPPVFLLKNSVTVSVLQCPKDLYQSGISDHAPISVVITHKAPRNVSAGRIPPDVC